MDKSSTLKLQTITDADAAVSGLFGGLLAGAVMLVVLVASGLVLGTSPEVVIGRFDPLGKMMPGLGAVAHFSVSAVYGLIFGVLWKLARRLPWIQQHDWWLGPVYGLVLFLAAHYVLLPEGGSNLVMVPPLQFLAAHLVYGLVLGLATARISRASGA